MGTNNTEQCQHKTIVLANTTGQKLENSSGYEMDFWVHCADCEETLFRISEYQRKIINLSKHQ